MTYFFPAPSLKHMCVFYCLYTDKQFYKGTSLHWVQQSDFNLCLNFPNEISDVNDPSVLPNVFYSSICFVLFPYMGVQFEFCVNLFPSLWSLGFFFSISTSSILLINKVLWLQYYLYADLHLQTSTFPKFQICIPNLYELYLKGCLILM